MNKLIISAAAIAALLAGQAMADTQWQKDHPRREQVNSRLNNQDKRIHNEVKDGQITKAQAKSLHQQDHQIRQEERDMASHDNSHLTKADQNSLNQQENAVSHEIGK